MDHGYSTYPNLPGLIAGFMIRAYENPLVSLNKAGDKKPLFRFGVYRLGVVGGVAMIGWLTPMNDEINYQPLGTWFCSDASGVI